MIFYKYVVDVFIRAPKLLSRAQIFLHPYLYSLILSYSLRSSSSFSFTLSFNSCFSHSDRHCATVDTVWSSIFVTVDVNYQSLVENLNHNVSLILVFKPIKEVLKHVRTICGVNSISSIMNILINP